MSDDMKAMGGKEVLAEYGQLAASAPWPAGERERIAALEAELLRRLEAGEKAEAELKGLRDKIEAVKAEASRRINDRLAKIDTLEEELADQRIHGGEMFKRAEKAEAALNLAETTRESWRKEAEALEAEVEGLRAERDHHRQANEALRARNVELEDAERIAWCKTVSDKRRVELVACYGIHGALFEDSRARWVLWAGMEPLILNPAYVKKSPDSPNLSPVPPVLTPEARALIDAAREKGAET